MKVFLGKEDYESISNIVRNQLRDLIPENEYTQSEALVFGPEFMATPLRISTPSTQVDFDPVHKKYIQTMRNEIKESNLTPEEQEIKNQQLKSIMLFGQLLFSQSASLHFLKNPFEDKSEKISASIEQKMEQLRVLVQSEGVQFDSSRFDALTRRKEFSTGLKELKQTIHDSTMELEEKKLLFSNLSKARDFYYQANDFNFKYAKEPSRSFSTFINTCERYGSKISLAASIVAIGATAFSLIPALAPVMAPVALAATAISLAIGMPIALKKVGTMLYNLIRFQAAPTPAELLNATLLGTSLLLAGAGGIVGQAVNSGALATTADIITKSAAAVNSVTKVSVGAAGQLQLQLGRAEVGFYKSELTKLKSTEQNSVLDVQERNKDPEHSEVQESREARPPGDVQEHDDGQEPEPDIPSYSMR